MPLLCNIRELEGFFGEEMQSTVILLLYPLNIFIWVQLTAWQPSGVSPWVCIQQPSGLTHCPLITPDQQTLTVSQEWKWPMLGRVLAAKIQIHVDMADAMEVRAPGEAGGSAVSAGYCCRWAWNPRLKGLLRSKIVQQSVSCMSSSECKCWGKHYEEGGKSMETPTCDYAKCKVWLDVCAFSLRWLSHDYKKPTREKSVVMQFVMFSCFGFVHVSTCRKIKWGKGST